MDILEHPLEAVAFRLYSLPAEASAATGAAAWTCLVAVLAAAAAAGLWRLRSSTPAAATAALKPLELEPSPKKEVRPETTTSSARSPDSAASTTAISPKERYTAYYRDSCRVGCCDVDDDQGFNEEEVEEEEEEQGEEDDCGVYQYQTSETTTDPFGWEVVRSLPLSPTTAADMGRYRSPTALSSSSVVRLWDEAADAGVTAVASPRRRSRVVGSVSAF
ncbi:hypothetical protein EJB05_45844, partial [Eragrostis curvula]